MMVIMKFLLMSTLIVISPVWADRSLMINECHNADVPTICMQCLESDPSSANADPVGIAGIVLDCLDSRLNIITNNITNISREEKGEVKTVLEDCKKSLLTESTRNLSGAKTCLKSGDYDKADQSLYLALSFPLNCTENLKDVKFESAELSSQINIYGQLTNAAMRIIDRFSR